MKTESVLLFIDPNDHQNLSKWLVLGSDGYQNPYFWHKLFPLSSLQIHVCSNNTGNCYDLYTIIFYEKVLCYEIPNILKQVDLSLNTWESTW